MSRLIANVRVWTSKRGFTSKLELKGLRTAFTKNVFVVGDRSSKNGASLVTSGMLTIGGKIASKVVGLLQGAILKAFADAVPCGLADKCDSECKGRWQCTFRRRAPFHSSPAPSQATT
jgi:hypothetical protein